MFPLIIIALFCGVPLGLAVWFAFMAFEWPKRWGVLAAYGVALLVTSVVYYWGWVQNL